MGIDRVPVITRHEAVVEVPKDLVQRKQSENTSANSREKVIEASNIMSPTRATKIISRLALRARRADSGA